MKITRITVEYDVTSSTAAALAAILGSGAPVTIEHTPLQPATQVENANAAAIEAVASVAPVAANSRRRRVEVSVPGGDVAPPAAAPAEGSRRRRAAPPAAAPDPMPINDAEMSKAASNTAEVFVNLGEDGPGMVKEILKDFGVASAGDIPQDKRQQFLDECAKEIRLAKEEKEMAP